MSQSADIGRSCKPSNATFCSGHRAFGEREARRNTRGLTPNSARNARLKFETSPKPQSYATSSTLSVSAASREAASRRRARRNLLMRRDAGQAFELYEGNGTG